MSTRCNVIVGSRQFYHHYDGYPDGVGKDLAYFLANVNAGTLDCYQIPKDTDMLADYIEDKGVVGILGKAQDYGYDKGYEAERFGLHGDIEFLYLIDGYPFRLYCVDVWQYIDGTKFKGNHWEHPFYYSDLGTLKEQFIKPKYEIALPSLDVAPENRLYLCRGVFNDDEARYCGANGNLQYGEVDYRTGFIRVRNAKPEKGIRSYSLRRNGQTNKNGKMNHYAPCTSKIDQRTIEYNGQVRTIREWSELTGLPIGLINDRMKRGVPDDRLFARPGAYTGRRL